MLKHISRHKKFSQNFNRLEILVFLIFLVGTLVVGRLIELQIGGIVFWRAYAKERNESHHVLLAERGNIYLKEKENLYPVALNITSYALYAAPHQIINPIETAEKLIPFLEIKLEEGLSEENEETKNFKDLVLKLSKKNDFYELLKRGLSYDQMKEIESLKIPGIAFEKNFKRFYPEKNLFSQITGFQSLKDSKGQYGLEEYFNDILSGQDGVLEGEKAAADYFISNTLEKISPPINGADIILTIDRAIQLKADELLKQAIESSRAESGTIVVLEPKTGKVLAMVSWPDFDSNQYQEAKNLEIFKNPALLAFEPGSIFKVITLSAGLEEGKIRPDTLYEDKGEVKIGGYTIYNSDYKAHGIKNMTDVLKESLNTGAVFVSNLLGRDIFRKYVKNFGLDGQTGIELTGESKGEIKNLDESPKIYLATASFGQGISVTPLQMVAAFSSIANNGRLMKPYLVEKIIFQNGKTKEFSPQFVRQVVSSSSPSEMVEMMIQAVEDGYGKRAKVNGYKVAGKTGTAQVPGSGNYSEKTIHTFAGFAPADNPLFCALIKLDNPKKGNFSDVTATPVFGKLAKFILEYYKIPPKNDTNEH